jgi:DNA-binding XRE family transcriptional regulator
MSREKQFEKAGAARLRWVRETLGLTRPEFAALIGASYFRVVNCEHGRTAPQLDMIQAIARTFAIDVHWLVTGEGARPTLRKLAIDRAAIRAEGERAERRALEQQARDILERAA